jgi:protein SCO1/2
MKSILSWTRVTPILSHRWNTRSSPVASAGPSAILRSGLFVVLGLGLSFDSFVAGGPLLGVDPCLAAAEVPATNPAPATSTATVDTTGRGERLPDPLQGIGIEEHLDRQLPLDLEFTDESGRLVHLRDYFQGQRPVVLNLVYFTCPMLCTLVLNGVVESMNQIGWSLGREFDNVTVSIDPSETPDLARVKKDNYLRTYERKGTGENWHFLTGRQAEITALAEAVGFRYRYDPAAKQFIHTACTYVCTPDGRVSRYLYGIQYEAQTFRLALLEASQGRIGSTLDKLILYCYHYDAEAGRYAPAALKLVRLGGVLTVLALAVLLLVLRAADRRRRRTTMAGARP